jgi:hypothetical protein
VQYNRQFAAFFILLIHKQLHAVSGSSHIRKCSAFGTICAKSGTKRVTLVSKCQTCPFCFDCRLYFDPGCSRVCLGGFAEAL